MVATGKHSQWSPRSATSMVAAGKHNGLLVPQPQWLQLGSTLNGLLVPQPQWLPSSPQPQWSQLNGLLVPQPQSSPLTLGADSMLVSVDSVGSFPSSTDSPPGCHSPSSPFQQYVQSSQGSMPIAFTTPSRVWNSREAKLNFLQMQSRRLLPRSVVPSAYSSM